MVTNSFISKVGLFVMLLLGGYGLDGMQGCQKKSDFALPAGSYENGKINFVALNCNSCHSVADITWEGVQNKDVHLRLGGEVSNVKTYDDLLTSIINPSHKIARDFKIQQRGRVKDSPMVNYNEVMTIQELVDIVTFLGEEYKFEMPIPIYELW